MSLGTGNHACSVVYINRGDRLWHQFRCPLKSSANVYFLWVFEDCSFRILNYTISSRKLANFPWRQDHQPDWHQLKIWLELLTITVKKCWCCFSWLQLFAKVENEAKASGLEEFQLCSSKTAGTMGHCRQLLLPHDSKVRWFFFTKSVSFKPINPVHYARAFMP